MNDLEILRDSWEAPGRPDDAARAAARAVLMERAMAAQAEPASAGSATEPGPDGRAARSGRRRPRLRVRFAVVGLAAAAITAGAIVLAPPDERPPGPAPAVSPVAALQILGRAAAAAEHREFKPPRPDQWVYTHYRNVKEPRRWLPPDPRGPGAVKVFEEQWQRADGGASAFLRDGRLEVTDVPDMPKDAWPPQDYARLAKLPTDPDRLLELAYEHGRAGVPAAGRPAGGGRDARPASCTADPETRRGDAAFTALAGILSANLLPPKVEAAVYRAMSKIPDVTSVRSLDLGGGRPGLALGRRQHGWQLQEVLFDARTYRYAGTRVTAYADPQEVMKRCGSLTFDGGVNMRVVSVGVVDRAGQRP
ncbi:CU044_5270 family protein [Spirillospora sp. NPDC127200]